MQSDERTSAYIKFEKVSDKNFRHETVPEIFCPKLWLAVVYSGRNFKTHVYYQNHFAWVLREIVGRYLNWRRLDELRFEFSEPPRSIEVAVQSTANYVLTRYL